MYRLSKLLSHLMLTPQECVTKSEDENISSLEVFEFMNAILNGGKGGGINEKALQDPKKLRKVFATLDLDNSGDLDRMEWLKAARVCSTTLTDDEIQKIFTKIAKSNNNTIEFDEFVEAVGVLVDLNQIDLTNLDKDIRLVIETWDKYMNGNKKAAITFTNKLLTNPALGSLVNVDLGRQAHMVYGMLSNAFRGLSDIDKLKIKLEKEGKRHFYAFKLTDKHYDAVEKALYDTLPQIMGQDVYNYYTEEQFKKYFQIIKNSMLKGYNDR